MISEDVQLWQRTGDLSDPNVKGEKHDLETENKTNDLKTRLLKPVAVTPNLYISCYFQLIYLTMVHYNQKPCSA